jgi:hypothetical protein
MAKSKAKPAAGAAGEANGQAKSAGGFDLNGAMAMGQKFMSRIGGGGQDKALAGPSVCLRAEAHAHSAFRCQAEARPRSARVRARQRQQRGSPADTWQCAAARHPQGRVARGCVRHAACCLCEHRDCGMCPSPCDTVSRLTFCSSSRRSLSSIRVPLRPLLRTPQTR